MSMHVLHIVYFNFIYYSDSPLFAVNMSEKLSSEFQRYGILIYESDKVNLNRNLRKIKGR